MPLVEADVRFPSVEEIQSSYDKVSRTFKSGKTKPLEYRLKQLHALVRMLNDNVEAWGDVLHKDLRKGYQEYYGAEIAPIVHEAVHMIEHLPEYMKPEIKPNDVANLMDQTMIRKDPVGPVLIIGAWNYPINLTLAPLIGAIGAGCTAIIKPSELSSHSALLLEQLLPKYLDSDAFAIVNGAVKETTELLRYKWGHILYTGNSQVAKVIMRAAAEHLTPVTLELGGKSPAIVLDDCDVDIVASRLLWGRLLNAGQTCICIDYVLCSKAMQDKLIPAFKKILAQFYPYESVQKSPDFGRIINLRHFKRITSYLEKTEGQVVIGGDSDEKDLYIGPTVVINPSDNEPLMTEEIFGPVLPIRNSESVEDAVAFINSLPNPLALYMFSNDQEKVRYVLDNTLSGGVTVNDSVLHYGASGVPFGGVGNSGMGAYHGKFSFDTFVHQRATLVKKQNLEFVNKMLRYPPYNVKSTNLLAAILFKSKPSIWSKVPRLAINSGFIVLLVVVLAICMKQFQ